jgi:hypothetical protein
VHFSLSQNAKIAYLAILSRKPFMKFSVEPLMIFTIVSIQLVKQFRHFASKILLKLCGFGL